MKKQIVLTAFRMAIAAAVLVGLSASARAQLYDAAADMKADEINNDGAENNPNGQWSYGTSDTQGGAVTLFPFSEHTDAWGPDPQDALEGYDVGPPNLVAAVTVNVSNAPASPCCGVDPVPVDSMWVHPGADGAREYAIVQWTAPGDGTIDIDADWVTLDTGDVQFDIFHNATFLFSSAYPGGARGTSISHDQLGLSVADGDTIRFSVGNGGAFGSESLAFDATIDFTPVPEPSSIALAALGGLGLIAAIRRRRKA
jgi:MYXO-CTERM domain-containing protein